MGDLPTPYTKFGFDSDPEIREYVEKNDKIRRRIQAEAVPGLPDQDIIFIDDDAHNSTKLVQLDMDQFVTTTSKGKRKEGNGKGEKAEKGRKPTFTATDGFIMANGSTKIVREVRPVVAGSTAIVRPFNRDSNNRRDRKQNVNADDNSEDSAAALTEHILSTIVDTVGVTMDDIVGNEEAKRALEESVILPTLNPGLFTGLRQPAKGILLFGPPGNGKTMLAKAVATESKCTFFNISAASIMSKWVGEGEKLMQSLFAVARSRQPSIIFIDEVDSLLCQRRENEDGASRRVKTEFLLQFDGCSASADERILVLGATNRPQELDDGVLRRFPRRIYIDLPDAEARIRLFTQMFTKTNTAFELSDEEFAEISKLCEGYSFSDITALCKEAAMAPLRSLSRDQLRNCSATQLPPVKYCDLKLGTTVIRASANAENTSRLKEFATRFGQT